MHFLRHNTYVRYIVAFVFAFALFGVPIVYAQQADFGTDVLTGVGLGTQDIRETVVNILRVIYGILGLLTLVIIIYAGWVWMTAGGRQDNIQKAKKILTNAVIGLIILILAAALTEFVFSQLIRRGIFGDTGNGNACAPLNSCVANCTYCDATGNRVFDQSCGSCTLGTTGFELRGVQTAHDGNDPKQDVYLCSRVQPTFNRSVDPSTVAGNATVIERLSGVTVSGTWNTSGNVLRFQPDANFAPSRDYEIQLTPSLADLSGDTLRGCIGTVCEVTSPYFGWQFTTGTETDTEAPSITSAYPRLDNSSQNVSLSPTIDVTFSESIDFLSVSDGGTPARPDANVFTLQQLDGPGGAAVGAPIAVSNLLVESKNNGFRIKFEPGFLLEAFKWYRITVQDVVDLCANNQLPSPVSWEFQTNDDAPGITGVSPRGTNVCPNDSILVSFGTSMYSEIVRLDVDGAVIQITPDEFTTSVTQTGFGTLRVLDPSFPPDPVNGNFRQFEFVRDSSNPWTIGQTYTVTASAPNLIIDQDGNIASRTWDFTVASADQCTCEPYITGLSPSQGPAGQCLSIKGRCFQGTAQNTGTVTNITFTDPFNNTTGAPIRGQASSYVTTDVPGTLGPDTYGVTITTTYDDANFGSLTSNSRNFVVTSDAPFTGPCLYDISPGAACHGATITLDGIRFGSDPGTRDTGSENVNFSASGNVPNSEFLSWNDDNIRFRLPSGFADSDVSVTAGGVQSNSLPFDVSCGGGTWCSSSPAPQCTPENSACTSNICNPSTCLCEGTGGSGGDDATFRVIDSWPGCNTSCPNAALGATFNREIDSSSITNTSLVVALCDGDVAACPTYSGVSKTWTVTGGGLDIDAGTLLGNRWYRVIVRETVRDINGLALTNKPYDSDGDGTGDSFTWVFKTQENSCDVTGVDVYPDTMNFSSLNTNKLIVGRAMSDQGCFGNQPIINSGLDWFWTQDDASVATVTYVDQNNDGRTDPQQTVTSLAIGSNQVSGRVNGTAYIDYTPVTVALSFGVDRVWPSCDTACVNSEIGAHFTAAIDQSTVSSDTVDIYECNDEDKCRVLTPLSYTFNPSAADEIVIAPSGMNVNQYYRMVLRQNIRGVDGNVMTTLNYDEDGDGVDDAYTWIFRTNDTECDLTSVVTQPNDVLFNGIAQDKQITGKAVTDQGCYGGQFIDAWDYDWLWSIADTGVASFSSLVDSDGDGNTDPVQTITSQAAGTTVATGGANSFTDTSNIEVLSGNPVLTSCDADPATPQCNPNATRCNTTTYCNPTACTCDIPPAPSIVSITPANGSNIACVNTAFRIVFSQPMANINNSTIQILNTADGSGISASVSKTIVQNGQEGCTWEEGCSVALITPNTALPLNGQVDVVVSGSLASTYQQTLGSDQQFEYRTGSAICQLDGVTMSPATWYVRTDQPPQNTQTFIAESYSNYGGQRVLISPISSYAWDWTWAEEDVFDLLTVSSSGQTADASVTSRGQGTAKLTATAEVTTDLVYGGDHIGRTRSGSASIDVFICDFPWPDPPPYSIGRDAVMKYCRGNTGDILLPTLTETTTFPPSGDLLRDTLFTVDLNPGIEGKDAIGLRVYDNPTHASAAGWYEAQDFPQGSPRSTTIDGYEAVIDGRTAYIHFTQASVSGSGNYQIRSFILVLSHNQGLTSESQAVYDALIDGLRFNNSLTIEEKQNIQTDLTRIGNLGAIASQLLRYQTNNNGALPDLSSGSFIPGMSTSRWPQSWNSRLGNQLGYSMPVDPINTFAYCPAGYDQISCFNEALSPQFYCAEGSHIYVYKDGSIYANPEFKNADWVNVGVTSGDSCGSFGLSTNGGSISPAPALSFATTPPQVSITNPSGSGSGPAPVSIAYNTTQPGAATFYANGTVFGQTTVTDGNHTFTYFGLQNGSYTLRVELSNLSGDAADSISYTVTVAQSSGGTAE